MDITAIGTLASAAKTIVDVIKNIRSLAGGQPDASTANIRQAQELQKSFTDFQDRIAYISDQLHQTETLMRMLPIWLKEHSQFEVWDKDPKDDVLKKLDSGLRQFIFDSVHDHFSAVFFQTSFSKLPGVPQMLEDIRDNLKELDTSLNAIPHTNLQAWKEHLPIIKVRLSDLRIKASKLDSHTGTLRGELVQELKDAAGIKSAKTTFEPTY